uniref:Uncharacterized protein n=1 Tax=Anopheles farauti TaxID=69004 RepID=A0A182Q0G5_9DIPT
MSSACKHLQPAWMVVVVLFLIGSFTTGHGWNLPNSYYQGAGTGGYFGGSSGSVLGKQASGASAGSWNTGGGVAGGFDRTGNFGANQWGGAPAGGAIGGERGVDGAGFQPGVGVASDAGAGGGDAQNTLDNAGRGLGGSTGGAGQFGPHHTNGGFGGSFGGHLRGFGGTGRHDALSKTNYRPSFGYNFPSTHPWRYGSPSNYGGGRWPWYGGGYVYRVPVAHVNPDGSYSFSYYTPYLAREESGDGNGNVAGTYGFQNDGAKHNFSFSAGPDVDLRSGIGGEAPGALNPNEYGPQSIHSRARLPLVPQTSAQADADGATLPGTEGRPNSWPTRVGADGVGNPIQTAADESTLAVVGLPKAGEEATEPSRTTSRNQVVRGSTEPSVSSNVNNQLPTTTSGGPFDARARLNELDGRPFGANGVNPSGFQNDGADGTATTARPFGSPVEQVVPRPVNGGPNEGFGPVAEGTGSRDRSYQFGYQSPDATREESADAAGNVRGSFSYNNEAGRNDLQYIAGAGMGFRPTGGSLAVPNGLPGGAGAGMERLEDSAEAKVDRQDLEQMELLEALMEAFKTRTEVHLMGSVAKVARQAVELAGKEHPEEGVLEEVLMEDLSVWVDKWEEDLLELE